MTLASAIGDLVGSDEFQTAMWWAVAGLVVAIVLGVLSRLFRDGKPAPIAGVAIAVASLLALDATSTLPRRLAVGVVLLVLGGAIADLVGRPVLVGGVLAVPGALAVADVTPSSQSWAPAFVVVVTVMGGACVASFDPRHGERGLGPVLFAVSTLGVYATVPDTAEAMVLVGAAVPLVLSSWPAPLARLGSGGAYAVTGLLAWTAVVGGVARPASTVGAVASLGLLVAEPLGRALGRPRSASGERPSPIDRVPNTVWAAVLVASVQFGIVFLTARVAGLRRELDVGVTIAVIVLVASTVACALSRPRHASAARPREEPIAA